MNVKKKLKQLLSLVDELDQVYVARFMTDEDEIESLKNQIAEMLIRQHERDLERNEIIVGLQGQMKTLEQRFDNLDGAYTDLLNDHQQGIESVEEYLDQLDKRIDGLGKENAKRYRLLREDLDRYRSEQDGLPAHAPREEVSELANIKHEMDKLIADLDQLDNTLSNEMADTKADVSDTKEQIMQLKKDLNLNLALTTNQPDNWKVYQVNTMYPGFGTESPHFIIAQTEEQAVQTMEADMKKNLRVAEKITLVKFVCHIYKIAEPE